MVYDHGGKDDVTKANNFSQTPMYVASLNGHLEVIKMAFTISRKDDVTKADNNGQTPMYAASLNGYLEVINGFMIMVEKTMLRKLIILVKHQCM